MKADYIIRREDLIEEFVNQMRVDNATIFLGAGMSISCGMPSWRELLKPIFDEFDIDSQMSDAFYKYDYYDLAEKYMLYTLNRRPLDNMIFRELSKDREPSENHHIITRLPITRLWTTNFDTIIEDAYKKSGKKLYRIRKDSDFTLTTEENVKLYKTHGCISDPDSIVITKSDLHAYEKNFEIMSKAFSTALAEDTFLFLGFSFDDLHFETILGILKRRYGNHMKSQYAVLKRPEIVNDVYKNQKNQDAFSLLIKTLGNAGIKILPIDDYIDISLLLKDIEKLWLRNNIFISGSFDKNFHSTHVTEKILFRYSGKECNIPYDDVEPENINDDINSTNNLNDFANTLVSKNQNSKNQKIIEKTFYFQEIVQKVKVDLKKLFPYNDPSNLEKTFNQIGKKIFKRDMNIYTGYGPGICDHVVTGASNEFIEKNNYRALIDHLKIFPLPLNRHVEDFQKNIFYREAMLGSCGIMIIGRGSTFSSDYTSGTFEEYQIAKGLSNLLYGRQNLLCTRIEKIINNLKTDKGNYILQSKELPDLYETQLNLIRYQFLEIAEMFNRILSEQWKLVIRSIDAYRERMTIFIEKILCGFDQFEFQYQDSKYEKTNISKSSNEKLRESWLEINALLRHFVTSRTVNFYSYFEVQDSERKKLLDKFKFDESQIDQMLMLIENFGFSNDTNSTQSLDQESVENDENKKKLATICRSLVNLIQADWKYYVISKWREELDEIEVEEKRHLNDDSTLNNSSQIYAIKINEIWEQIYNIKTQNLSKNSYDKNRKEFILKKQIDNLLDDNFKIKSEQENTYANYVIKRYYENEKKILHDFKGNNVELNQNSRYSIAEEQSQKIDILKIQSYKIFLIISDIIGGLQRVVSDYETLLIEDKTNNNKDLRVYPNDVELTQGDEFQNNKSVQEKDRLVEDKKKKKNFMGDTNYDPFFYNPNKMHRYIQLQKKYIDYYQYNVTFMKEMVQMKFLLRNFINLFNANDNTVSYKTNELSKKYMEMSNLLKTITKRAKDVDSLKVPHTIKPFRSGTIILPLAVFGGMAKKIWDEEKIRFDYLCSNKENYDPETRRILINAYYKLRTATESELLESLFTIIDIFKKPPKS